MDQRVRVWNKLKLLMSIKVETIQDKKREKQIDSTG